MGPVVVQLHGVPGSGKSTLARELAGLLGAEVLDKDVVKSSLLDEDVPEAEAGPRAYELHFAAAADVLAHGRSVILDSPAFWPEVEERAGGLAEEVGARFLLVECVCGDVLEIRRRLAARDILSSQPRRPHAGLPPGAVGPSRPRLAVDTLRPAAELAGEVVALLRGADAPFEDSAGAGEWPPWATEPVDVVPHLPEWAAAAEREIELLREVLRSWLTVDVEHVGSTAVPGMPAKPILDLLAGVADLGRAAEADAALAAAGYELVPPEFDARPWRRSYVKPRAGRRYAHLHVMEPRHVRWRHAVRFRDHLRGHPQDRERYAAEKLRLAERHAQSREAYSHAKTELVADILAAATTTTA